MRMMKCATSRTQPRRHLVVQAEDVVVDAYCVEFDEDFDATENVKHPGPVGGCTWEQLGLS